MLINVILVSTINYIGNIFIVRKILLNSVLLLANNWLKNMNNRLFMKI